MLTLTFLGVGGAFAKRNFQSNALVEAWSVGPKKQQGPDDTLLIDFGVTGPIALNDLMAKPGFTYLAHSGRINYSAIRRVFVSHLHGDHVGGLEELAMTNTFEPVDPDTGSWFKPELTSSIEIIASLWDHSLKGGLSVLRGRHALLQDYFRIHAIQPGPGAAAESITMLDRYELSTFATDHIRVQHKYDWPSLGLLITDRQTGETVVYSGDSRFDPDGIGQLMSAANLNFHEVQLDDSTPSVHALLSELRTLPEETRKKTLLYHYGDTWDDPAYASVSTDFTGFAKPQQRYTLFK